MKKTVIYTLVSLVAPALSMLFLPIYLKYLSQSEYITLALSNSFIAVISVFLNGKVEQAYRTIYFYNTDNETKQLHLFRTLFGFQFVCFIIWILVFYFIGNPIFKLIYKNDIQFVPYTFIILISFLIGSLSNFYLIYLQNKLEVKKFSYLVLTNIVVTHFLQLTALMVFKLSFAWYLIMGLLSNLFVFLLIYIGNPSLFKFEIKRSILREALKFSLPFIPFLILYNIESQLDRFFIDKFLSVEELAKYVVLLNVSSVVVTLFNSVDNSIRPELFSILSKNSKTSKLQIQNQMDFYLLIGILCLSFLLAFGTNIGWFLDHEKYNGIKIYFPYIVLAFFPLLFLRFLALILIFENKVTKINYYSIAKIIVMSVCFYLLIPNYKIYGALVAIGMSNVLNVFIFYKILTVKVSFSRFVYLCALSFGSVAILLIVIVNSSLVSLISILQFIVFISLFSFKYRFELNNQYQLLKMKLS